MYFIVFITFDFVGSHGPLYRVPKIHALLIRLTIAFYFLNRREKEELKIKC